MPLLGFAALSYQEKLVNYSSETCTSKEEAWPNYKKTWHGFTCTDSLGCKISHGGLVTANDDASIGCG